MRSRSLPLRQPALALSLSSGFMAMLWQATMNEAKTIRELGGNGNGARMTWNEFELCLTEAEKTATALDDADELFNFEEKE